MTRIGPPPVEPARASESAQPRRDREPGRDPFRDPRREPGRDHGQSAFGSGRDVLGHRDPKGDGTRSQARGGGAGARGGQRDTLSGFEPSGASFQRLIEERARDGDDRGGSGRDQREDGHVLAVAEPKAEILAIAAPAPVAVDQPSPTAAPQEAAPGSLATGEGDRMAALAERVESAVRLDRVAQACGEATFRLVGAEACGLASVGVAMTGTSLDVTLTHDFTGRPDEIVQAAAILAQQLGERFPTRRVRILQGTAGLDAPQSGIDGLAAIGRWLARPS